MKIQLPLVVLVIYLTCNLVYCQVGGLWNTPTVETSYGKIRGSTFGIGDGRMVHAYYGIPYAASPTRGNRFRVSNANKTKISDKFTG